MESDEHDKQTGHIGESSHTFCDSVPISEKSQSLIDSSEPQPHHYARQKGRKQPFIVTYKQFSAHSKNTLRRPAGLLKTRKKTSTTNTII